jgi:hypothetical protein
VVAADPVVHGTDQEADMLASAAVAVMHSADSLMRVVDRLVAVVATGAGPSEECYFELNSRRPSSNHVQHCCPWTTLPHHELHLTED